MRLQAFRALVLAVGACAGVVAAMGSAAASSARVVTPFGSARGTVRSHAMADLGGPVSKAPTQRMKRCPRVMLSPRSGPPTSTVRVSGTGFGAHRAVDIYFDTTDEALAATSGRGSFSGIAIRVPASAVPGTHVITAVQRRGKGAVSGIVSRAPASEVPGRHCGVADGRRSRLFAQAAFTVNTNWAQFHFSASHTGFNPYENVLSAADVARLGQDWTFHAPFFALSSPAVASGLVYVGSHGYLHALNAATGALRWSFPIETDFDVNSPAVANGIVYASSDDGKVYALSAATGAQRWTFNAGSTILPPAAVASGVVYIGSDNGNVYALNAATGARLWTFTTGGIIFSSPAIANGVVYIGSADDNVYAVNAATGAELWSFRTKDPVRASPAVARGVVYIGSGDGIVYALNAATGRELWTFNTGQAINDSPAVADGTVYIGSDNGYVYALDAATGATLWRFAAGGPVDFSSPAVADGVVYIGSADHNVYALNAATGARLWTFITGNIPDSPAVANGVVYIVSDVLYAFDLTSGPATLVSPSRASPHLDFGPPIGAMSLGWHGPQPRGRI